MEYISENGTGVATGFFSTDARVSVLKDAWQGGHFDKEKVREVTIRFSIGLLAKGEVILTTDKLRLELVGGDVDDCTKISFELQTSTTKIYLEFYDKHADFGTFWIRQKNK